MKNRLFSLIILLFAVGTVYGQIQNPVKWSYAAKKGAGGIATIYLKAEIQNGWHIYSVNQKPGGPQKTEFTFAKSPDYILIGKVAEPKPETKFESAFDLQVYFFNKSVTFTQQIKLKAKETSVKGKVGFMVCNETQCLPPDEVAFTVPVK